jgi:phospholipid/cholesterol/gamma-HCH transport system substrate-binding protein
MSPMRERIRLTIPILLMFAVGIVSAGYLLIQQRFPVPFKDTYEVKAVLAAADGVAPGFGQSVNVSGVKVGTISAAKLKGDKANVTFTIDRDKLPAVYRDARADLRPITPLKDMQVELSPGTKTKGKLPEAEEIGVDATSAPVPLSDLLSTLDADTRTFLSGLIGSLDQGTKGRAPDVRRVLRALGPTTTQLGEITRELDTQRVALSRLVTNVAAVTKAAASDGRLADVVVAGNRTLNALARQDEPLRQTLAELPSTLRSADESLRTVGGLSDALVPALRDLNPPVAQLPTSLKALRPVTEDFSSLMRTSFRPAVKQTTPLAKDLGPSLANTARVLPDTSRVLQGLTGIVNELGYNPDKQVDQGMLKWLAWVGHNFNSVASTADAHGAISRALPIVNCSQAVEALDLNPILQLVTGTASACNNPTDGSNAPNGQPTEPVDTPQSQGKSTAKGGE